MEGSDKYSTPQDGHGDPVITVLLFLENYKRERVTFFFFFFSQGTCRPELGECDEYSTPSPITVSAWSTCDSCGESDEDSAPSSTFNPLAGISSRRERIAAIPVRG